MAEYIVLTEDYDSSMKLEARDSQEAVDLAVLEWGIEADPGFKFYVFQPADAEVFQFALKTEPVGS